MKENKKWKDKNGKTVTHLPAIPPNDYSGTMADWITELYQMGYERNFYGDIMLTVEEYDKLLEKCEVC